MIISDSFKYVFVSVPKTGTHTMFDILTEHFEGEHTDGHYHDHELPPHAEDYFRFCTVRSPYNRIASAWSLISNRNAIHRNQVTELMGVRNPPELIPFLEWLVAHRESIFSYALDGLKVGASLTPIHLYFEQRLNNMEMDAVIQIENATEDFNKMPFVNEHFEVPKIFSFSKHPWYTTWDDIKTPEVTELVNEWAGLDFDKFNYIKQ